MHPSDSSWRVAVAVFLTHLLVMLTCVPFTTSARSSSSSTTKQTPPHSAPQYREGELLVRFRAGVSRRDQETILARHGAQKKQDLRGDSGIEKLKTGRDVRTVALELLLTPQVDDNIRTAAAKFKDATELKWYAGPDSGDDLLGRLAGQALWFFNQVKDKGPWDYKYRDPAVNEGKRSKYESFGNFNYGAAGAAAGFTEGQLLRMAGYYQTDKTYAAGDNPGMMRSVLGVGGRAPYGDEPADQNQIRSGVDYYRRKFVLQDCQ